ncbi:MAG: phospholipid carrier-dependent glycosyltransferase [Methylococcaceae bacterium]|nr:phospholipid carrier-dependent glycosyltransferase [Methylococcaceae bacterium]
MNIVTKQESIESASAGGFYRNLMASKIMVAIFLTILVLGVFAKLYRLDFPKDFYFDEIYHGFTATVYLHGDKRAYDPWAKSPENRAFEWTHPPLSKLIMAGMMGIFGENSFGWRVGSVVLGTLGIVATAVLAFELFGSLSLALTAMGLLSLEGLYLTQSRVAMNDSYLVFFMLLTFIAYVRWRKSPQSLKYLYLTGLGLGLALATKWSALYLFIIIAIDLIARTCSGLILPLWLADNTRLLLWKALVRLDTLNELPSYPFRTRSKASFISAVNQVILPEFRFDFIWALGLIPVLVYLASYTQYFYMGYDWSQFVELQKQMWWYHSGLKATHPYQSTPWQWLFDLRPIYMYVDASVPNKVACIYNLGNAVILYFGFFAVLWNLWRLVFEKGELGWQRGFIVLAYFMLWVPWLFSPRMMLFYHYLPAVPLLCIILALWLKNLRDSQTPGLRWLQVFVLSAASLWFVLFFPHNTGMYLKNDFMDSLYYALPSWR